MSDNRFWLSVIATGAFLIGFIVAVALVFQAHADHLIARMVATGTDPVAAHCALRDPHGRHPACLTYIAKP